MVTSWNPAVGISSAVLLLALVGGCRNGIVDAPTLQLEIYSGDEQVAPAGSSLAQPLVVRVVDEEGRGVRDVVIHWVALEAGGALGSTTLPSVTNGFGVAQVTRTLGPGAGIRETVASLDGSPDASVVFTSVAQVQGGVRMALAREDHGDQQADTVLAALEPFRVLVEDQNGDAVAGVAVRWLHNGDGSLSADTTFTDGDGVAAVIHSLGTNAHRSSTVQAIVIGLIGSPVQFTAEVRPGRPVQLLTDEGDAQIGAVDQELTMPYRVIVADAHGNPNEEEAVVIDWEVTSGGGSIAPSQGVAEGSFGPGAAAFHTLGPEEGLNTALARAGELPGAPEVTFTATGVTALVRVALDPECDPYYYGYYSWPCPTVFAPDSASVPPGRTVGWSWSGRVEHNVVFEDDPDEPTSSRSFRTGAHLRTFDAPGVYRFRCTHHSTGFSAGEVGRVTVR